MRSVAYIFTAAVLAAATPAFAQQAPADAAFSGAHIDALVGVDRNQGNNSHDDGLLYGLSGGYDVRRADSVFGVEVEASDSNQRNCIGSTTVALPKRCTDAGRDLYVGGRIGVVARPGTLLYAKAGYTNADYRTTQDVGRGATSLGHDDLSGVRVGAGIEQAITPRSFVKAEYRYSNYEQGAERHQVLAGVGLRF